VAAANWWLLMTNPTPPESTPLAPPALEPARRKPRFRAYSRPRGGENGIGGFLALFVFSQILGILYMIVQLPTLRSGFRPELWALGEQSSLYRPLVTLEAIGQAVRFACTALGLFLLFKRHPETRRFYRVFLGGMVLYGILDAWGASVLHDQLLSIVVNAGRATSRLDDSSSRGIVSALRTAMYGGIWFLYWERSDRVSNTFPLQSAGAGRPM
jgi:hypothetical protein